MHGEPALLPVREAVLVHERVVEAGHVELGREHVRALALAAGAIGDDRLARIVSLAEERLDLVVDVRLPDRKGARAGDVALAIDARAPRVEERYVAALVEREDVVAGDLDPRLLGMGRKRARGR